MYTIDRINKCGTTEHAEFWVLTGERFIDKLEEVLYILYEETPLARNWWSELQTTKQTRLTYHNLEFSILTFDEAKQRFIVTEE